MKPRSGLACRVLLLSLIATLAACGQQGPLYLPDAQMPRGKAAKRTKGVPKLPPAQADTSQAADKPADNDEPAIVPVTPSIPD